MSAQSVVTLSLIVVSLTLGGSLRSLGAQVTTVRCQVQSHGGQPIPNAHIEIPSGQAWTTDSTGWATVTITRGLQRVKVRALGYQSLDTALTVGAVNDGAYVLKLRLVELPRVEVRATMDKPARYANTSKFDEFYRRRAGSVGTFFTREDIEASGQTDAVELLRKVRGVRVTRQPQNRENKLLLRFARCSVVELTPLPGMGGPATGFGSQIAIFVNGIRTDKNYALEVLDDFRTEHIEAMEVYSGPSQLPMEAMGDACAAIFIWTRY